MADMNEIKLNAFDVIMKRAPFDTNFKRSIYQTFN